MHVRHGNHQLVRLLFRSLLLHAPRQGSCFCTRHPDLGGKPIACVSPDQFGFGSVHYIRDLGDSVKMVQAMRRVEADGQVITTMNTNVFNNYQGIVEKRGDARIDTHNFVFYGWGGVIR